MLVQQFYENPDFKDFLTSNFVLYRATRGNPNGDTVYKRYAISATPTTLIVDPDGKEIDWHVGYSAPPVSHQKSLQKTLDGDGTYLSLLKAYEAAPDSVEAAFNLARKWDRRYNRAKATELYEKVLALDPDGSKGTFEYQDEPVTYTAFTEYSIGQLNLYAGDRNADKLMAFIAKYPGHTLAKTAYSRAASFYMFQGTKEESTAFFEKYVAEYPEDPYALDAYVTGIIRKKGNLDRGLELAEKARALTRRNPDTRLMQNLAQLHVLKDDSDKAAEVYGKDFMENRVSTLGWSLAEYAEFWGKQKRNQESAEKMMLLALELKPTTSYLKQMAATFYLNIEKEEKALEHFGPAYIADKTDDASELSRYAYFWAGKKKNLESALKAAKQAVDLQPTHSNLFILGQTLYHNGQPQAAVEAIEKAIETAGGKDSPYAGRYGGLLKQIRKKLDEKQK